MKDVKKLFKEFLEEYDVLDDFNNNLPDANHDQPKIDALTAAYERHEWPILKWVSSAFTWSNADHPINGAAGVIFWSAIDKAWTVKLCNEGYVTQEERDAHISKKYHESKRPLN